MIGLWTWYFDLFNQVALWSLPPNRSRHIKEQSYKDQSPKDEMLDYAEPVTKLIDEFKRLPSIGQKSAQRLAFHILRSRLKPMSNA